jgi:2-polyprenyl-3-methyl-5-hydroxy-6-metoxy-1,4-benzoquinol methylase
MDKVNKIIKDFNGETESIVVPHSKKLTKGYELNISKFSGLVSVIKRRSSKQIANNWSNKIFGNKFSKTKYTAKIPAVIARHIYVLETIIDKINIKKKKICDLGAGEGQFLEILKKKKLNCELFGIEPSKKNCKLLKNKKIKNFNGTVEEYYNFKGKKKFDVITLMWTLCNTSNCLDIIKISNKLLKKNGYIVVAESSRMLVPFKKPIQMYFGIGNPDIHPFHFSKNSLANLLIINKFKPVYINRYIDSDYLLIIAKKINKIDSKLIKVDNFMKVKKFFKRWYKESLNYKKEII